MDTLTNDIVPIGAFEACPVTVTGDYLTYPGVVRIGGPFDYKLLYREFKDTIPLLDNKFLKSLKDILIDASPEEVKENLISLGWEGDNYKTYSIRQFGTNILSEAVLLYTRQVLSKFRIIFRQQYMCAKPMARLKPHIDNLNCEIHGFKVHIPLNVNYYVFVESKNGYNKYVLPPGYAYYLNSSLTHFVVNPTETDRINLSFQLASDELIHKGDIVSPVSHITDPENIDEIYAIH